MYNGKHPKHTGLVATDGELQQICLDTSYSYVDVDSDVRDFSQVATERQRRKNGWNIVLL